MAATEAPAAMIDVGELVPDPFVDAIYVEDLLWHEGPLVTEFRTPAGEPLLYWFADIDARSVRWIVVRLTHAQVRALKARELASRDAIAGAVDGVAWMQDRDGATVFATRRLACADIPEDYLPSPGGRLSSRL